MKLKTSYPIGIDIGKRHIFAAQVREGRTGFVIGALGHRWLPHGGEEADGVFKNAVQSAIREILKDSRFRGKRAVVALRNEDVISFPIHFEAATPDQVEAAIVRESHDYVSFPIEEAILDYPSLHSSESAGGKEYQAIVVAVHRGSITSGLKDLKQAGLLVEAVDLGVSALIRLHQNLFGAIENPVILCHIGAIQSLLTVVAQDRIMAQREVPWGVESLTRKLRSKLMHIEDEKQLEVLLGQIGLQYEERENKGDAGVDPIGAPAVEKTSETRGPKSENTLRVIYQIIVPQIEDLLYEFHKIMGYVRSEVKGVNFEQICLYGQGATIRHLDRYLEKRLNITVHSINPLEKMAGLETGGLLRPAEGAPYALALGLAMRSVPWL